MKKIELVGVAIAIGTIINVNLNSQSNGLLNVSLANIVALIRRPAENGLLNFKKLTE
jgi:hypothetical protein